MYTLYMEEVDALIAHYEPTKEVTHLLNAMSVALLVGITGAGKDTLQQELLKTGQFEKIITSTTRQPRLNNGAMEQDGNDYYFFTTEQAIEKIKNRQYFEVAKVHGRINGCTNEEIKRLHRTGNTAIADIDYQGAAYYKRYAPNTTLIFVVPPSYEEWERRMRLRYANEEDLQAALPERLSSAVKELAHALETDLYHVIVNDRLETAVEAAQTIIADPTHKTSKDDGARHVARTLLSAIADRLG